MKAARFIVVGVTGGIACYKAVDVVSRLKKEGYDVKVVMTKNAQQFVSELTFRSISNNEVIVDMFDAPSKWEIEHISIAEKADLFLIMPASANIIGKISNGIADDFLTTSIMATTSKTLFVPAMNHNMYENKIVSDNIDKLKSYGYSFLEPETGTMACSTYGKGRFPQTNSILEQVNILLNDKKDLVDKKVLITSGPTLESFDPVRYISNHSSGKMGKSLAFEALKRGAKVTLISGPVYVDYPKDAELILVNTGEEMHKAVFSNYEDKDIIIMAAAVSDYKVENPTKHKIKKSSNNNLMIELSKNPDIAKDMGQIKKDRLLIGFCAETQDLIKNAKAKIKNKNLDMIVANDITKEGAYFGGDTNIVAIIDKDGNSQVLPVMKKERVAREIFDEIIKLK